MPDMYHGHAVGVGPLDQSRPLHDRLRPVGDVKVSGEELKLVVDAQERSARGVDGGGRCAACPLPHGAVVVHDLLPWNAGAGVHQPPRRCRKASMTRSRVMPARSSSLSVTGSSHKG